MADTHKTQQTEDDDHEALRLKTLAESKYNSTAGAAVKSSLKYATLAHRLCPALPGLSEMLTAFRILQSAAHKTTATHFPSPEYYAILDLDPFSSLNSIRTQYKKLALLLHPDKSSLKNASGEAFKLVNDAFHVLSDRGRRKEYDTKLRLALQSAAAAEDEAVDDSTFWTACSRCQLMHKFERKYVGHRMVCPNCNQGFKAFEVAEGDDEVNVNVRRSARARAPKMIFGEESSIAKGRSKNDGEKGFFDVKSANFEAKKQLGSVNKVLAKPKSKMVDMPTDKSRTEVAREKLKNNDKELGLEKERSKNGDRKRGRREVAEGSERESPEEGKEVERELTLAEMKLEAMKKMKGKKEEGKRVKIREESEEEKKGRRSQPLMESGDMEVMAVEDSDFYDFDEDRVERSFKKGQVWAIYDDDDGMPRHYGLIDEVVSVNPFQVKMSWLDLQNHGEEQLISWEKMGFRVSCGRFKVARKDAINLLNIFSHLVGCERAARELYRIYPRKASVWALYNEQALVIKDGNSSARDGRHYDIVVLLTSYSEMHGLSMAYLEKVDGFRAVFKRREIGVHAIRWLEKDDIRLFSHQIPARKLSGNEAPDLSCDCWELDPASLPSNLLAITGS